MLFSKTINVYHCVVHDLLDILWYIKSFCLFSWVPLVKLIYVCCFFFLILVSCSHLYETEVKECQRGASLYPVTVSIGLTSVGSSLKKLC